MQKNPCAYIYGSRDRRHRSFAIAALGVLIALPGLAQTQPPDKPKPPANQKPAQGQDKDKPPAAKPLPQLGPQARYDYQGEATFILQHLFPFPSKYEGPNSFRSRSETELSHTYTAYLGARLVNNVEVYINPEIAWGNGLSGGNGLAAYTDNDVIGQPSLRPYPYLARYFVRWRVPMPHVDKHADGEEDAAEQVGRAPNIIAGPVPAHRLVIQAGKFGVTDVFDVNSYANNARTQFINDAFGNNLAYDYAEETRGYDLGASIAWVNPTFVVRFGSFAMPTSAGGPDLAYNFNRDHSEQLEVELHPQLLRNSKPPFIVRLLGYRNVGDMGDYREAPAQLQPGSLQAPDITMTQKNGRVKYGFGINFEQALADGGNTGVFGRLGWDDGATEDYNFVECDRFLSFGGQLAGTAWKRGDDRVGLAWAQSDLSSAHRDYLAAGGLGFVLGDGNLRYGPERVLEAYYLYQLTKPLSLTLDYQFLNNPGYNRDRGPASVISLRAHVTF